MCVQVALLIDSINKEGITINNNTHLVGFSLGAHVSGFVGKELKNLSRITGIRTSGNLQPLTAAIFQDLILRVHSSRDILQKFVLTKAMQIMWMLFIQMGTHLSSVV